MSGDQLIGDVAEVVAVDVVVWPAAEYIVRGARDQRRLPARRDGAERVPCVAGDKTETGRLSLKLPLDIGAGLARRFMVLHAVGAEPSLEEIDDAAMLKLTGLNLEQIIRE